MADEANSPAQPPLERKLSTILSADVAEYSRLMGEDEEQTLNTFRGHKQVFESWWPCIAGAFSTPPARRARRYKG